jgi:hypothetical protein
MYPRTKIAATNRIKQKVLEGNSTKLTFEWVSILIVVRNYFVLVILKLDDVIILNTS